jgi:hypothetical protein
MTEQQSGAARPPYPREPNVHSGGVQEPGSDRDLPPYDDRQKAGPGGDSEELVQERGGPGYQAPPREVSEAERQGVGDTDLAPKGPHKVGQSPSTSGEDLASGMSEASQREDRLDTGVSDEDTTGPAMHRGDQGG